MAAATAARVAARSMAAMAERSELASSSHGCSSPSLSCMSSASSFNGSTSLRVKSAAPWRRSSVRSRSAVTCAVGTPAVTPPTVADTKQAFLLTYKRPIPTLYNNVIQELLVQQHLIRYNSSYKYDPIFALGFVTVYDQLMDGYANPDDVDVIFRSYIEALKEDPEAYRRDAAQLEEWAGQLDAAALVEFPSRDGPVETILKDIAARAGGSGGGFHYSRLFAIGLFRLMELAKASEPATLEKLCAALQVNKMSVDRDLDVYRGLLSKLSQAKELLQDFLLREKQKQAEREKEKAQVKAE